MSSALVTSPRFVDAWRRAKSRAFDLERNSTAGRTVTLELWGAARAIYANATPSISRALSCTARCTFCVEELRPASRGVALEAQKTVEPDDGRYFARLEEVLEALRPLDPSVSVTGGEPSKDPRLPRILRTLARQEARKRTLTSNGSGLLDVREGQRVIDWIAETGVRHLNISRASVDHGRNARLMRYDEGPAVGDLHRIVATARAAGVRVRLSAVLIAGEIDQLPELLRYLDFAEALGVDNVIFRQLMQTDPRTTAPNHVVRFSDARRVRLEAILDAVSEDPSFDFVRQVMGYYYYVEVWRRRGIDVVFEEADLARLEDTKRPGAPIHELIFHPSADLASTWQPWDGVLGPR